MMNVEVCVNGLMRLDCVGFSMDYAAHDTGIPRLGCKPHVHNAGEIMLAGEGSSVILAEGKVVRLTAPYFIFIPEETLHEQINDYPAPYSRYCISLSKSYLDGESVKFPHEFLAFGLTHDEYARLEAIARLMIGFFSDTAEKRFPERRSQRSDSDISCPCFSASCPR